MSPSMLDPILRRFDNFAGCCRSVATSGAFDVFEPPLQRSGGGWLFDASPAILGVPPNPNILLGTFKKVLKAYDSRRLFTKLLAFEPVFEAG
jgi:hypothetical protein